MAEAFPASTFHGADSHSASIQTARQRAQRLVAGSRIGFEAVDGQVFSGGPYDLVTMFDCPHDMGDPIGGCTPCP